MKKLLCIVLTFCLFFVSAYAEEKEASYIFDTIEFDAASISYNGHSVKIMGRQYYLVVSFIFQPIKKAVTYFAHEFKVEAYQNSVKCIDGYIPQYAQEPTSDVWSYEQPIIRVVFEIDNPDDDVTIKVSSIGSNKDTDTYVYHLHLTYTGVRP